MTEIAHETALQRRWNDPANWETPDGSHWSKDWGGTRGCWYYTIRPRLPAVGGDVVCEIGCGRGQWIPHFLDDGWRYLGLDVNQSCVDECNWPACDEVSCRLADGTLPKADLIFSWGSLLSSPATAVELIRQCGESLGEHGAAFLHVPNVEHQARVAAREVGLYCKNAERVDWPTGAANCWLLTLTRGPCETRRIMQSTLRAEMAIAANVSQTHR